MGIPLVADMGGKKKLSFKFNSSLPFSICKIGNVFYTVQTMGTWLNELLFIVSVMVTRLDPFHLKAHEQHLLELLSIKWWEGLRLSVCHTAGV